MKNREKTKEQLIKELEDSLRTNDFLSLLLESMPVAVYTCEVGGDFGATYISNNITALTGYKPEDFTSDSEFWFYNVHPDDQEMVNMNIAVLLETGHITYEYRWRIADGSYKWFYDISKLMKTSNDGINYIIGTFIDITQRKKTEEALRTNEEKYRSLFSTEQDAIVIVNADTRRIVDANDAALRLYGYSKEEILKLTGLDLSAVPEESDAAISKVAMSTDKQVHYHTRNHKKKNGTVFPVEISSGIFMLQDGKFISAAIRDITERRLAEESLQKSNEELEIRVKKRTADLTSTVKTLQREIKERKQAQKEVEIYQGQLRALISNLTTIEEKLKKRISEELHDNIGQCLALSSIKLSQLRKSNKSLNKEIKEILKLIEQTIRFIRSLSFELVNPILYQMGLIPAIKWLSGEIKEKHGIDVDFESNEKLNKLNVETSVLLFKTINELLLNVVKHSKAKKAVVSLTSQGDNLQVKVEDNGIGFNTSEINNYIIDNNSLGIFKISEKIKYLGGTFDIKSKPGQGTVVTFITPIH